ncbi:hypothetical protein MPC4_130071 [Methylocella tundrae]|uniref:Uncharacterized protein n=1 Tax=Methylocella tundrae TaxID=227605 RepID=A0A8B6M425_METTU|nr:hypothetical protein MPC1_4230004 [Methylocella tundrae]VTZ49050.1 hypothetical protein MPC4_130071 [Methylocella tundrae]
MSAEYDGRSIIANANELMRRKPGRVWSARALYGAELPKR